MRGLGARVLAALRACGVGPFTLAAHLRGTEQFLIDTFEALADEEEVAAEDFDFDDLELGDDDLMLDDDF